MKDFPTLIQNDEMLKEFVEALRKKSAVALDTEFHCERRYWPDLFLVQLAADGISPAAVDPLAVSDLTPLGELFADPSVVKVIHSARNDLGILFHCINGFKVVNLFDSQVAASFLGYGEQISLVNLVQKICGVKARKKYSMSDWSARPLDDGQIEYALDDVRYLVEIHRSLSADLQKKGRTEWFQGEQESLADPETYRVSLDKLFSKARSAGKVKKSNFPLLWRLVNWRENTAMEKNRPRQFIARDHLLCRLAVLSPSSVKSISRIRGLPGGFVEKFGEEIVQIASECRKNPPKDVPVIRMPRHDWGYAARKDIIRLFLKMKSKELGLSPGLLLSGESLESILESPPITLKQFNSRSNLSGWRKEVLGRELVQVLSGELAISLKKGKSVRFVKVK
ncbi:hypothetical protein CSA37_11880 [Candidatus Fermentibacteria bacterium]|nr:MAG: hypothetical protein CSA37_11880 [Candidatus Fermentibacteria bacterium]